MQFTNLLYEDIVDKTRGPGVKQTQKKWLEGRPLAQPSRFVCLLFMFGELGSTVCSEYFGIQISSYIAQLIYLYFKILV